MTPFAAVPAPSAENASPDAETRELLCRALERMGLTRPGEAPSLAPLAGGVSSDIYRAELPGGAVCVKRALPRLKVAQEWSVPVERSRWEYQWMRVAGTIAPEAVPRLLGEDRESGTFAMEYLDPARYPVWKARLRDGVIDTATGLEVARRLVRIHAATAGDKALAKLFATDHIFHPIRLEPYLAATAQVHCDVACALYDLLEVTATSKRCLVHGDVSPKNILLGPRGPVFLDAECAWYGDPAFDLAFCLNHLLLKCLWRPEWRDRYLQCFGILADGYLEGVTWEPADGLEARTARLLPGLFLARVDGKSPVEYVTEEADRQRVRRTAKALLMKPVKKLSSVATEWREELDKA